MPIMARHRAKLVAEFSILIARFLLMRYMIKRGKLAVKRRDMSEWVNVKLRMPDPGQFVFAYGDACQGWVDGPKMAVFRWWNDSWWDANMDAELADGVPTHWMPLPEPPEQPSGDIDA